MNNCKKILTDIVGIDGYETLSKAIFRRGTENVADPLELYLPLLVVPRTLLSWLAQNIRPLKIGEHKVFKFPGREDISMNIEKQNTDTYRGEFVQGGKIIHQFDRQTLPSIGGHLMTVGEVYDDLEEKEEAKEFKEADKDKKQDMIFEEVNEVEAQVKEKPKHEMISAIMEANDVRPPSEEESKWMWSHANVKELTSCIGKLADALVANYKVRSEFAQEIDKKELKGDEQKVKEDKTPAKQLKEKVADIKNDKNVVQESRYQDLTNKIRTEEEARKKELDGDKQKVEDDKTPAKQLEEKVKDIKNDKNVIQPSGFQDLTNKRIDVKKEELSAKAEMPAGAGAPKPPKKPELPKPPVPASNQPAASAAKQSQSSAKGQQQKPPKPNMTIPKMPKQSVSKAGDFFRTKLSKLNSNTQKSEKAFILSHSEVYNPCHHCGIAEFVKDETGKPKFRPCACFKSETVGSDGKTKKKFVDIYKDEDGQFKVIFEKSADQDSVKAFLYTLKLALLAEKRLKND